MEHLLLSYGGPQSVIIYSPLVPILLSMFLALNLILHLIYPELIQLIMSLGRSCAM